MIALRFVVFVLGLVVLFGSIGVSSTPVQAADTRPDVIVIMVDDMAYLQSEKVLKRLPNIRKVFLKQGKRYQHMYNETPLCCPARANFFSGQHTLTNGVYSNWPGGFNHNRTLTTAMSDAGYYSMLVGKYLNSYKGNVVPPGWDKAIIRNRLDVPIFWVNGKWTSFKGQFHDSVVKNFAVKWLANAPKDRPVFEFVSPWAPHRWGLGAGNCKGNFCQYRPKVMKRDKGAAVCRNLGKFKPPTYHVKPNRREWPMDMPSWPNGWPLTDICESLLVVDRMVGQIVAEQKKRGRPAYFVFMSDNGMSWGQKSYPLKHVPTSARLPFYVKGPGVKQGGNSWKHLSIIDVPVTIADIAGASTPWADGRSFLRNLHGVTMPDKCYIEMMHRLPGDNKWPEWKAIRCQDWLYIRWKSGKKELYKYRTDHWLQYNKAKARPDVVKRLNTKLNKLVWESKTHPKFR